MDKWGHEFWLVLLIIPTALIHISSFLLTGLHPSLLDLLVTGFRQTASRDQRCTVLNEVVTTDVVFDIIRKKRGVFVNEPPDPC